MPIILSNSHRVSKIINKKRKTFKSLIRTPFGRGENQEKRDAPFGSSEEFWAMNENLTQLIKKETKFFDNIMTE